MSSLVTGPDRSVAGKMTRSALVTRRSRPPASTIVLSDAAMPVSSTATFAAPASLSSTGVEDGLQRSGVEDVPGGGPAAARRVDGVRDVAEPAHGVRVGRADDPHAGAPRVAHMLGAQVEPVGQAVHL